MMMLQRSLFSAVAALVLVAAGELQAQNAQGLLGEYYNFPAGASQAPPGSIRNPQLPPGTQPGARRIDAIIDLPANFPPPAPVNGDYICIAWTGYITVPTTGDWEFGTRSDDGVIVVVDGVTAYNKWQGQGAPAAAEWAVGGAPVPLTAGVRVSFRCDWYNGTGGREIEVWWRLVGGTGVLIPASAFQQPDPPAPPPLTAAQLGTQPQIDVSWTGLGADHTYDLQRSDDGGPFVDVPGRTGTTAITYTDTSVQMVPGRLYCYRVRATRYGLLVGNYSSPAVCVAMQLPAPRTNDHDEGLFDDKCSCGSIPAPTRGAALAALLLALGLLARRR